MDIDSMYIGLKIIFKTYLQELFLDFLEVPFGRLGEALQIHHDSMLLKMVLKRSTKDKDFCFLLILIPRVFSFHA